MRRRNRSRSALRQLVKEEDDLVALDETALEDRTALQDAVIGIVLDASDKVHAIGIERGEPGVVVVAVIENHNGSGLEAQGSGDAALVHTAFGNDGIAGQQTLMVEQQMQFHRAFGAPVLRPVKDRGAEFIDSRSFAARRAFYVDYSAVSRAGDLQLGLSARRRVSINSSFGGRQGIWGDFSQRVSPIRT